MSRSAVSEPPENLLEVQTDLVNQNFWGVSLNSMPNKRSLDVSDALSSLKSTDSGRVEEVFAEFTETELLAGWSKKNQESFESLGKGKKVVQGKGEGQQSQR